MGFETEMLQENKRVIDSIEVDLIREQKIEQTLKLFQQEKEQNREILRLYYIEGWESKQIAEELSSEERKIRPNIISKRMNYLNNKMEIDGGMNLLRLIWQDE